MTKPPPMRHVVKGWWLYEEFDTMDDAENYLREWKVKTIQLLVLLDIAVCVIIFIRLSL